MIKFTAHLEEVNETYTEHFSMAMHFAFRMFVGALACAVHAVLPCAFERTGSSTITDLHEQMVTNRKRLPAQQKGAIPLTELEPE